MNRNERLRAWASALTEEQMRSVLIELVEGAIDGEEVSFYDTTLAPYWSHTGEPLIDGQITYNEDD